MTEEVVKRKRVRQSRSPGRLELAAMNKHKPSIDAAKAVISKANSNIAIARQRDNLAAANAVIRKKRR